jgi:hypothetical protein
VGLRRCYSFTVHVSHFSAASTLRGVEHAPALPGLTVYLELEGRTMHDKMHRHSTTPAFKLFDLYKTCAGILLARTSTSAQFDLAKRHLLS